MLLVPLHVFVLSAVPQAYGKTRWNLTIVATVCVVQAAIGLCLQGIDAHITEKGVVDRAAGIGDVEVVDVDGERAVLARHCTHECREQLATALDGVLRCHLDGQDAVDAH